MPFSAGAAAAGIVNFPSVPRLAMINNAGMKFSAGEMRDAGTTATEPEPNVSIRDRTAALSAGAGRVKSRERCLSPRRVSRFPEDREQRVSSFWAGCWLLAPPRAAAAPGMEGRPATRGNCCAAQLSTTRETGLPGTNQPEYCPARPRVRGGSPALCCLRPVILGRASARSARAILSRLCSSILYLRLLLRQSLFCSSLLHASHVPARNPVSLFIPICKFASDLYVGD